MSVFSELVNDSGIDPDVLSAKIYDKILADPPEPWNLPAANVLDLWGDMNLRTMFAIMSGGESPTTFTGRDARMVRAMAEATSLLDLRGDPTEADRTRALDVLRSLKSREAAEDAEVIDVRPGRDGLARQRFMD